MERITTFEKTSDPITRVRRDLDYALLEDCRDIIGKIPAARRLISAGTNPADLAEIFFAGAEASMTRIRTALGSVGIERRVLFDDEGDDEY